MFANTACRDCKRSVHSSTRKPLKKVSLVKFWLQKYKKKADYTSV